jgi:uroporphyrinogen-III synthase
MVAASPVVWVLREAQQAERWAEQLRVLGVWAKPVRALQVRGALDAHAAKALVDQLKNQPPQALAWVSANAVRGVAETGAAEAFFGSKVAKSAGNAQLFATNVIANAIHWVTGSGSEAALLEAGVERSRVRCPSSEGLQDSEALWALLQQRWQGGEPMPQRVWVMRGQDADGSTGRPWLVDTLRESGVEVVEQLVYRRHLEPLDATTAEAISHGTWVCSNAQLLRHVVAQLGGWPVGVIALCTHPRIEQAARELGAPQSCVHPVGTTLGDWHRCLQSLRHD